jgi:hyaluronoglucosaminidase
VRDFAIALDDIAYDRWNCTGDRSRYGPNTGATAARAQTQLLNRLQREFVGGHAGTRPLTLVPTEYRNTDDSPYRTVLRTNLDPAIQVMWTGSIVVPPGITAGQAAGARAVFGRPVVIWDNYPVNDFPKTTGRLLLGPYVGRDPALVGQVGGLISNPMNQAAASKVALTGIADFTWNAPAYDAARAQRAAANELAAGGLDPARTVEALLAFFDLETYAPTSSTTGSLVQGQAPALAAKIAAFNAAWSSGDRKGAVAGLRPYAELLAAAPQRIRDGVRDAGFVADCRPWLDALGLWGQAFVATLDGLQARIDGDQATAGARFAAAHDLAARARVVHTIAGETKPQGPVLVGDGVLDSFLRRY